MGLVSSGELESFINIRHLKAHLPLIVPDNPKKEKKKRKCIILNTTFYFMIPVMKSSFVFWKKIPLKAIFCLFSLVFSHLSSSFTWKPPGHFLQEKLWDRCKMEPLRDENMTEQQEEGFGSAWCWSLVLFTANKWDQNRGWRNKWFQPWIPANMKNIGNYKDGGLKQAEPKNLVSSASATLRVMSFLHQFHYSWKGQK